VPRWWPRCTRWTWRWRTFPRIIGLRDGQLAFDLPAAEVTRERLAALYDQFEHELRGEVPVSPPTDARKARSPW
jgi:hypothetical protein